MRSFSINLILSGGGGGGGGIGESDAALVGTAVLPRARELRTRGPVAAVVDAPHFLLQSLSMLLLYFLLLRGGVEVLRAGLSCIIVALLLTGG